MCGIAGYVGQRKAIEVVFDQLKRLEYRGYDSAGIAYVQQDEIQVVKRAGKLSALTSLFGADSPEVGMAIGHSRWATHGEPNDTNAHPHFDQHEQVAIIHNGIIENYHELKQALVAEGHRFLSDTDTEVAAHIIGRNYTEGVSLEDAVREALPRLRGAFALVVVSKREPGKIVVARQASPLVLGVGEGEAFLASDIPALLPYTRKVIALKDGHMAVLDEHQVRIYNFDGVPMPLDITQVDWDIESAQKGGYEHFMLKEIHEQPEVIRQCLAGRIDDKGELRLDQVFNETVWNEVERVTLVACGTSYHAGLIGKYLFEQLLRLPTDVFYSSEFRYGDPVLSPRTLAIMISQSGETADTLAALKLCKERRIRTLGIVNVIGSSIARECDRVLITQAGPEISVASTKAYTAQVLSLMLLVLHVAQVREMPGVHVGEVLRSLQAFDQLLEETIQKESEVIEVAQQLQDAPLVFFLGRGIDAAVALEGALKMKEIAYLPTQECPAGEMKHGPLALIEKGVWAVVGSSDARLRAKLVSNVREIQARGGKVALIAPDNDRTLDDVADALIRTPSTPYEYLNALLTVPVLQLLAYHTARLRGEEIDQPRNLAKSVTVE